MKNINGATGTSKKFVNVSLPAEFAAQLREQANSADRSMSAQLEHWAKVARAIEAVIPAAALTHLKAGGDPSEVLSRLSGFLTNRDVTPLRDMLAGAKSPMYGADPTDPNVTIRHNPDGSRTRGRFEADGTFTPFNSADERSAHDPKAARERPRSSRQTGAARAQESRKRTAEPV